MSSISYTISAFDADTMEYLITYPVAGTSRQMLVPAVKVSGLVNAERTKQAIEIAIRATESPEIIQSVPDNVDDLIGYSGEAQITNGVV